MKRFLVVLLLSGLIVAFSTPVLALDLKFSGEFYVAGLYLDKTTLQKRYWSEHRVLLSKIARPN